VFLIDDFHDCDFAHFSEIASSAGVSFTIAASGDTLSQS